MCLPDNYGAWPAPFCSCERCPGDVPHCARFQRWAKAANVDSVKQSGRYQELLEEAARGSPHLSPDKERQLQLDLDRTWPSLRMFSEHSGGRQSLANLLKAWIIFDGNEAQQASNVDRCQEASAEVAGAVGRRKTSRRSEAVGYVQGMNFIVTALLWHCMAEEAVFWLFVATVHNYDLRSMFEAPDMHGLKVRSFTIAQLVHQEMPDLSAHLAEHMQNSLSLLFTEWLLTLFAGSMPLTPLAILWDHFFQEGYSVIYRLILARLRCLRPWLLAETDFGVLVHLVKNAHLDFIGPDCRPWPRPARPGLPGFAVEESSPKRGEGVSRSAHTDGTAVTAGPQPMMSRRRGLLRRLVRARDTQTVNANSCPPVEPNGQRSSRHADSDGSEDAADGLPDNSRPVCESCEGGGGEHCSSWEKLVTDLLKAEIIDLARTAHYERMLAEPPTPGGPDQDASGPELREKRVQEENVQLSRENAQLRRQLAEALREVESLRHAQAADRLRTRLAFETCCRADDGQPSQGDRKSVV